MSVLFCEMGRLDGFQGFNLFSFFDSHSFPAPASPSPLIQSEKPMSSLSYLQHSESEQCPTNHHSSQELVMVKCHIPHLANAQAVFPPLGLHAYARTNYDLFATLSSLGSDHVSELIVL